MSVTTSITAASQTASSNGPDGASDPPSAVDDAIRYALSFIAMLRDGDGTGVFASVASAATLNLNTSGSINVDVTGTTTITGITLSEGRWKLVRFGGALTLTNGASLVLPGGANITTAAGDFALVVGRASGVVAVPFYQRASALSLLPQAMGQCRLAKSGSNLVLSPFNGNLLTVAGVNCTIPAAGVSLAPTGLLATTLYYIYAVATAGVITSLEASTTGHSTDTTAGNVGVEIKTGDNTRSLVGMAYVKTAATFADTADQRFVLSWFNRKPISGNNPWTSNGTRTNSAYGELSVAPRLEFLVWSGDIVDLGFSGSVQGGAVNSYANLSFGIDSTSTAEDVLGALALQPANAGTAPSLRLPKSGLAEGYHYATLLVNNAGAGNQVTVFGGGTAGNRSVISGVYLG